MGRRMQGRYRLKLPLGITEKRRNTSLEGAQATQAPKADSPNDH